MKTNYILTILKGAGKTTDALLDILAGGHSYPRLSSLTREKLQFSKPSQKHNFYSILSRLRSQGFIEKKQKRNGKVFWSITRRGLEKLEKQTRLSFDFPLRFRKRNYKKELDESFNIVAFDIPEESKRKREWLRETLVQLGFKMLQKSLWIGKIKLPEQFLRDLKTLKILDHVHIFKVNKAGTIKK